MFGEVGSSRAVKGEKVEGEGEGGAGGLHQEWKRAWSGAAGHLIITTEQMKYL